MERLVEFGNVRATPRAFGHSAKPMCFDNKNNTMNSLHHGKLRSLLPLVALVIAPTTFVSAATTVLQDDMSAPSYTSFSFNNATLGGGGNADDIGSSSSNPIGSAGNPGSYFEVTHHHDVDRDGFGDPLNGDGSSFVQSFFKQQTVTYTPSVEGGIGTITFSIDLQITQPFSQVFFAIDDSGGGSAAGFMSLPPSTSGWQTFTSPALTQANFSSRDFNGSDPFKFSFGFTSSTDVTAAPSDIVIGADNFTVMITPVPEPTSGALAGAALLAAGLGRVWRQKRSR